MNFSKGFIMLPLESEGFGGSATLYPTLIGDGETAVLIDTGMPGNVERLVEAIERTGMSMKHLQSVILTHQDLDHIGCAPDLVEASGNRIQVLAHAEDVPYIEGRLPLIKTTPKAMEPMLQKLPDSVRQDALRLLENPPKVKVDRTVEDGERLTMYGGVRIIHTPGHSAGHICLYLEQSKTLVAADALMIVHGKLHGPVPQTSLDIEQAFGSLKKLLELDIERIICYHGGMLEENCKEQLAELCRG
jgi:glyoxylase-like metal-dependent hydrolase (beta-lactamase superfamily II)